MGSPVHERSAFLDPAAGPSPDFCGPIVRRRSAEKRRNSMEKVLFGLLLRQDVWRFHHEAGTLLFLPNRPADAFSKMRWALVGAGTSEPVAWYSETEHLFGVGPHRWVADLILRHGVQLALMGAEPGPLWEQLLHNSTGLPGSTPGPSPGPHWAFPGLVDEPAPINLHEWLEAEVLEGE